MPFFNYITRRSYGLPVPRAAKLRAQYNWRRALAAARIRRAINKRGGIRGYDYRPKRGVGRQGRKRGRSY